MSKFIYINNTFVFFTIYLPSFPFLFLFYFPSILFIYLSSSPIISLSSSPFIYQPFPSLSFFIFHPFFIYLFIYHLQQLYTNLPFWFSIHFFFNKINILFNSSCLFRFLHHFDKGRHLYLLHLNQLSMNHKVVQDVCEGIDNIYGQIDVIIMYMD